MSHNPLEVPDDRLSSIKKDGSRSYIYPAQVKGFFHNNRVAVQGSLMILFLILPWITIGGHQAVLLDIPNRKFALFGLTFWAHDTPIFFFVLAILTLTLSFVTSVWGRVWCGWACPQTVFIESVFRRIEKWVEGNHHAQRKLDQDPWNGKKIFKKSLKWSLFTVASLIITHSFLAYFIGTKELAYRMTLSPFENLTSFLFMISITLLILFDFGWFREQFCIIACPYGRFQSVLMDPGTINVTYDFNRGEPRKGSVPQGKTQGDCVNCFKCVQVCPTGIDIRKGLQLECIACTACIDACDEIMEKVKKPKGLIRYTSESDLAGKPSKLFRPRNFLYLGLITVAIVGLITSVSLREEVQITLLRPKDSPFSKITLENGNPGIINHFKLHITNQRHDPINISWKLKSPWDSKGIVIAAQSTSAQVMPEETLRIHFFLKIPESTFEELKTSKVAIEFIEDLRRSQKIKLVETNILMPLN